MKSRVDQHVPCYIDAEKQAITLFPDYPIIKEVNNVKNFYVEKNKNKERVFNIDIDFIVLKNIKSSLTDNNAPEKSGITYETSKSGPDNLNRWISELFIKSIKNNCIPAQWKSGIVIWISKNGGVRPITLLN